MRGGSSPSAEEVERFFANRVGDYAKLLMLIFAGLYVMGAIVVLTFVPQHFARIHLHPGKLANIGLVLWFFAIWHLARRPGTPAWLVSVGDLSLPLTVMAVVLGASFITPEISGLFLGPLLMAALVLVTRAALVPSTAGRSAVVGVVTAIPSVASAYVMASHESTLKAPLTPALIVGASLVWMTALVGSTAMISSVIYGLHREIARARRLGPYELGDKIGEGGMGAVYRAEHALLKRPAAIKLLLPERAGADNIARFEREVRLTAQLAHPNTVAVYDYGRTPDGLFYYAMEYLRGLSLDALVSRFGPQPPGRVALILGQAAGALAEAHALGLIHRDVKPANIFFCERGGVPDMVKLLDFGLVKHLGAATGPSLTQSDALTGTPLYISPEALSDPSHIDHRADIYALGGVGYFLLTGRPPFEGRSVLEICGHHLHTTPEPPSERLGKDVPAELEALVMACLAKKPGERPADAEAVLERLRRCGVEPWSQSDSRAWWRAHPDLTESR